MAAKAGTRHFPSNIAVAVALVLGCALTMATVARAAKNALADCEEIVLDFHSYNISVDALTLNAVDHLSPDSSVNAGEPLDPKYVDVQAVATPLTLTPRAASILDQAFASDSVARVTESNHAAQTSPLADSSPNHPGIKITSADSATVADDVAANDDIEYSRIQDRMFRSDI